jgi:hypothetical protein
MQPVSYQPFELFWPQKKKDCLLPDFSLFFTPMAPRGARGEPVSSHFAQVNKQQTITGGTDEV